jgi:hypothetical protein
VSDLALRLGADPTSAFTAVSFSQTGKMRLSLESRLWLPFKALQTMSVTSCAFAWRARFRPFGYLAVTDALEEGLGRLDVTALGLISLVRTKPNAALTRGELIRYLAELPLAPDAMLHNHDLEWREVDISTIAVTAGAGETRCEVVFSLGPDKRIRSAFSADRSRSAKPPYVPMPWRGEFADYRQQNGRWIPSAARVGWEIDGKEFLYWQGRIEHWEMSGNARFRD